MARFLRTADAAAALRAQLEANARAAADENALVARDEQSALHPFLLRHADALRERGGPGTRVHVDALVERAYAAALATWAEHNPPARARDARFLALDEIAAIERDDPVLGALTRALRSRLLARTGDPLASFRAWFDGVDFSDRSEARFAVRGLPGGRRVDARAGQPGRAGLPAELLAAFDFYDRAEAADIASVSLHRGAIDGHDLWAIFTTTDGDDAYLELLDPAGATIAGARLLVDELLWDEFPGRVRLAPLWTRLTGFTHEEGYSEPAERAAAGQPPRGWVGELRVDQGHVDHVGGLMGAVDFGALTPTAAQRELAVAALELLWDLHLRHTVFGDAPLELGPRRQGVLTIGPFTRSTSAQTFLTASWRDIDDGSFVLYFVRGEQGLHLHTQQFDN